MHLLDLPLDVFRLIIASVVRELGAKPSMRARLVCRTFADAIPDAVITTRALDQVDTHWGAFESIAYHHDFIARYLYHRVRTDASTTHPWITTVRDTCRMLARHAGWENDPVQVELLERAACFCLALNVNSEVFAVLQGKRCDDDKAKLEGGSWANCLALAACIGDLALVRSLNKGSDPPSFFGTPSWAAAAHGHVEILQFFLDQGALPYNPAFDAVHDFQLGKTPLGAAAYMGHERIVQLYLHPVNLLANKPSHLVKATYYAAQGNRTVTLRMLIEYHKENFTRQVFLSVIGNALLWSCERGTPHAARMLLDYGADPDETDYTPNSCLQLATRAGDSATVKMLLNAGALIEAPEYIYKRSRPDRKRRKTPERDALTVARLWGFQAIVELIEEKEREMEIAGVDSDRRLDGWR